MPNSPEQSTPPMWARVAAGALVATTALGATEVVYQQPATAHEVTVQDGDTFWEIESRDGVQATQIPHEIAVDAARSGIANPHQLQPGQKLEFLIIFWIVKALHLRR